MRNETGEHPQCPAEVDDVLRDLEGKVEEQIAELAADGFDLPRVGLGQVEQVAPPDLSQNRIHRFGDALQIGAGQEETQLTRGLGQVGGVALGDADEHLAQTIAHPPGHAHGHTEIDEDELKRRPARRGQITNRGRLRAHEQVTGVRVGVEELGHEDLLEVRFQQQIGHFLGIDARLIQRVDVRDLQRLHVFQHDDALGGVLAIDLGDIDLSVVGVNLGEVLGVVRFRLVIQLFP